MLKSKESVETINEARQAQEQNVSAQQPVEDDCGSQVVGEATSAMNDVLDFNQNHDGDDATATSFECRSGQGVRKGQIAPRTPSIACK